MKISLLPFFLFTLVCFNNACQTSRLPTSLPAKSPYLFFPCKGHLTPEIKQQFTDKKQDSKGKKSEKTDNRAARFTPSLQLLETLDLTSDLTP